MKFYSFPDGNSVKISSIIEFSFHIESAQSDYGIDYDLETDQIDYSDSWYDFQIILKFENGKSKYITLGRYDNSNNTDVSIWEFTDNDEDEIDTYTYTTYNAIYGSKLENTDEYSNTKIIYNDFVHKLNNS